MDACKWLGYQLERDEDVDDFQYLARMVIEKCDKNQENCKSYSEKCGEAGEFHVDLNALFYEASNASGAISDRWKTFLQRY